MKKRFLSGALILSLLFALSACAGGSGQTSDGAASTPSGGSTSSTPSGGNDASAGETVPVDDFYAALPYQDLLPVAAGPVLINGEERPIKIGFSQTALNHPWRVEMNNSAQAEADRHSNVSIVITDGNVDIVKQSSDISDLIAQGCDAIVMSPVESGGLVNAVNEAAAAGIPVIVLDRDVYTDTKTVFIGQSNYNLGKAVGTVLAEKLNGKGKVLEITGLLGSSPAIGRHEGFMDAIKDYPEIEVLAQGDGEWIREPAVKLMDDWLTAFPEIDAVYSHAEESSWGAELAIERAGRQDEGIMHFTSDGSNEGFRSVKDGTFMADGNYTPYIGQLGVRAALRILMGEDLEGLEEDYEHGKQIVLPDLPVVVEENADEWIGKGWGE